MSKMIVSWSGRFNSVVQFLLLIPMAFGFGSASVSAAIYAKFGSIEGEAENQFEAGWTALDSFELTVGSLPSGSRDPLRVFEADFAFELDSTYVPLIDASFHGILGSSVRIEHTAFYGEGGSNGERTYLAYEIKSPVLGPINLRQDNPSLAPIVWGKIISADELITTYSTYDAEGTFAGDITTALKFRDSPAGAASVSALQGNYNLDDVVDADDYAVWRQLFGSTSLVADGNGDGVVNLADYTVWRNNLGAAFVEPSGSYTSGIPVPEPKALVIVTLAIGLLPYFRVRG